MRKCEEEQIITQRSENRTEIFEKCVNMKFEHKEEKMSRNGKAYKKVLQ